MYKYVVSGAVLEKGSDEGDCFFQAWYAENKDKLWEYVYAQSLDNLKVYLSNPEDYDWNTLEWEFLEEETS